MSTTQVPSVISNLKSELAEAAGKSFEARLESELKSFRSMLLGYVARTSPRSGTYVTITMSSIHAGMADHVVTALRTVGLNAELRSVSTSYEYVIAVEIP